MMVVRVPDVQPSIQCRAHDRSMSTVGLQVQHVYPYLKIHHKSFDKNLNNMEQ